jgi:hypothetical protein
MELLKIEQVSMGIGEQVIIRLTCGQLFKINTLMAFALEKLNAYEEVVATNFVLFLPNDTQLFTQLFCMLSGSQFVFEK